MSADDGLSQLRSRVDTDVVSTLLQAAEHGFLGGMPVDEQVDHALGFVMAAEAALGRAPSDAVDLGTGGGVPGLVLHCCWPGCRLVLVDGNRRRTEFLSANVAARGKSTLVEVVRGRVEEVARDTRYRGKFELVTARSFGPPGVTAECGAVFLEIGGVMVVSEPPDEPNGRWPVEGLAQLGLSPGPRVRFDNRFGYQVLVKSAETPDRYPRRVGIPSKRPLF